jgi:hypothetical protein
MRVNDTSSFGFRRALTADVFLFTDRATDVVEKQFLRCDMTGECPFLVTRFSPYCDR